MVDAQPFVNALCRLQNLISTNACQRNELSSKIHRGVAAINGILIVHVRSLPQIADIGMCVTIVGRSTELLIVPLQQGKCSSPCSATAIM